VPDGLRADPDIFTLYKWAEEGKLPNIKRMMDQGSYGYSIPVFPSHTPVNFATLFTGTLPIRHGVADGPIHIYGYPLKLVPRTGFSSLAKTIDPFWFTLEQAGKIVTLLSVPGSTPPEITDGQVIKGRWGGWGMEFPNILFHSYADQEFRQLLGWNDKVFQIEKKLTEFVKASDPVGWQMPAPVSYSPLREISLRNWGADLFVLLADSTNDQTENYDRAYFSFDKRTFLTELRVGQWSDWFPLKLSYEVQRNYQEAAPQKLKVEQEMSSIHFDTQARIKVMKLGKRDLFRIRVLYDGLNESVALPASLSTELHKAAGPMVDFVDNFPPQLIYFPEDKEAFIDESEMSFAWHKRAEKYFIDSAKQDVFIQSIYSPNQMLTSRWWMGYADPRGREYHSISESERGMVWDEILHMYQHIDEMIGLALDKRDPNAYVVLSSDHGAIPLNYEVRLNNLFAQKGWLKAVPDPETGVPRIDWAKTKVVFLKMNSVFINPDGLDGNYQPAHGPAYEKLRAEVSAALAELKDKNGVAPLAVLHTREEAGQWGLPQDRVGDLIIANTSGYGWIEDVTTDHEIFAASLKSGYKQAILPETEKGLWTPFLIVGPGVRAGHKISRPIGHVEQYPTVMKLLGVTPPYKPDGEPLAEVLESTAVSN
jgi:predicted AlkP superfamily phosphohydrolase/phosphomutase